MTTAITEGIRISVETFYQDDISYPLRNEHVFAYRITIENKSQNRVQLMARHWYIFDANCEWRDIAGDGVVGRQPVLEPGELYQYVSGCHLLSEIGTMHGVFKMLRKADNTEFDVKIPKFEMYSRARLN